MSNTHKVATDALATLGTIIDETQKRDAIHLAVIPAMAGEKLYPGQNVGLKDGKATVNPDKLIGIVDPFLTSVVHPRERFWLIIYPRVITSLRHVWTHPDLQDEVKEHDAKNKELSEKWLQDFCSQGNSPRYDEVMRVASERDGSWGSDEYLHFSGVDAHGEIPPEFWDHFEVVTDQTVPHRERAKYFSCSC